MATDPTKAANTAELVDMLFTVMPRVAEHVDKQLEGLGMSTTDYWALRSVDGPMPMKDLAMCMEIDPSYVTLVADRLEKLGLIERQAHPTDRRVKNLVLTAKGRRFKKTVPGKLWSGPNPFDTLTDDERNQLIDLLKKPAASGNTNPSPLDKSPSPDNQQ